MFRQRKRIDVYIGDDCNAMSDRQKEEVAKNVHSSHSFINLFKKKANKKEANMKRVKSANVFVTQESVANCNSENGEPLTSLKPEQSTKGSSQKISKSIPRTKSMPNMSKHYEHNANANSKEIRKSKISANKAKNQEGQKQLQELVKYLHTDTPVVTYKQQMDNDDIELMRHLGHCVDLNKYFEQSIEADTNCFWKSKMDSVFYDESDRKSFSSADDPLSANGFRLVRRFGHGIPDGCGFPLSLKKEEIAANKPESSEWPQILEEAEQTLHKLETFNRNVRRGSLLQPRIMFISFYPANGWQKIRQIGHCLPLRKWTSELLFESKEAAQLLNADCKRHLKWNVSVGNIQQWTTNISNDTTFRSTVNVEKIPEKPLVTFRRQSLNENVWNANDLFLQRKIDYTKKMKLFTSQYSDTVEMQSPKIGKRSRLRSIFANIETECSVNVSQLDQLAPDTIAQTLTAIVRELCLKINANEIFQLLVKPALVDEESCPGVAALLGFQKRVINLFTTSVVELATVEERAKRMALIIEVAEKLRQIHNWHSVFSVISSCQSPPIARLKQTWNYLSQNYSDHFCEFLELSESLGKCDQNTEQFCIPIFDDWLRDLKSRCTHKSTAKSSRTRGHWQKPETIAVWLNSEIVTLEELASKQKPNVNKTGETRNKHSKTRSFIQRFKKSFSNKNHNGSTRSEPPTECIAVDKEANDRHNLCCKEQFKDQNVDISQEKSTFEEVKKALNEYQSKAVAYQIDNDNEIARNFLLLQPYKTMHENMSHSYLVEPPIKK